MDFQFHVVAYDRSSFLAEELQVIPRHSGVYKVFDIRGKLIVLDKTHNLFERLERFYGERSEMVRDLDLREWVTLVPIALLCLAIGVYPQPILATSQRDVDVIVDIAQRARQRLAVAQQQTPPAVAEKNAGEPTP